MSRTAPINRVEREGTVAAPVALALVEITAKLGADRAALLALLGTPDPAHARFPITRMFACWEHALRQLQRPDLPARVAEAAQLDRYGVFGFALYVSRTMTDMVRRLARYHDLLTDSGRWSVRVDDDRVAVCWTRPGERTLGMRAANEQVLGSLITVTRRAIGILPVQEVRLDHARTDGVDALATLAAAPVRAGAGENAIILPRDFLAQPSPAFDAMLERYFLDQADAALAKLRHRGELTDQVAKAISTVLADGVPSAGVIAAAIGVSERTLRRRLAAEGARFDELVAELQRERAEALLAEGRSVGETALAVGFTDASAFARAFRRWTGRAPTAAKPTV